MGTSNGTPKRLFLEVEEPQGLLAALASPQGAFVPTRMPVSLGDRFVLAVRLKDAARAVELPVRVLGRRIARAAHGPLSSGVVIQLEDDAHPMATLLGEIADGRAVDVERRIQENLRLPVRAAFHSLGDALQELAALAETGEGQLPILEPVARGDHLAVTVTTDSTGPLLAFQVVVRSLIHIDQRRTCAVSLVGAGQRRAIEAFLDLSRVGAGAPARGPGSLGTHRAI